MTSDQRTAPASTALPPSVILGHGEGGLSCIRVTGRGGEAEIYLQGAHLTSWQPAGQEPVIWTSRASAYSPNTPIRGGIPICFPWFGPNTADPTAPLHGLARLHDWELVEASEDDDNVALTFQLTDSGDTRSPWPFHFTATYRVIVGRTLQLSLKITNLDTRVVTFEEALHTYFAVGDVRQIAIRGLTDADYVDRTHGADLVRQGADPVRVESETDRLYLDSTGTVTIEDTAGDRVIRIRKGGSDTTVVWNPWVEKSKAMPDFGDDEWVETVCVETCNAGLTAVQLNPNERHEMTATIDVLPLGHS